MLYNEVIKYGFNLYLQNNVPNEDVRNFLSKHERLNLLINNLSGELKGTESKILGKNISAEDKRKLVEDIIEDFSRMFCSLALEELLLRRGVSDDGKKQIHTGKDKTIKKHL